MCCHRNGMVVFDTVMHLLPQLEEELQDDLKWCMLTKQILHVEKSKFQDVELIESGPFGKVRHPFRAVGIGL